MNETNTIVDKQGSYQRFESLETDELYERTFQAPYDFIMHIGVFLSKGNLLSSLQ